MIENATHHLIQSKYQQAADIELRSWVKGSFAKRPCDSTSPKSGKGADCVGLDSTLERIDWLAGWTGQRGVRRRYMTNMVVDEAVVHVFGRRDFGNSIWFILYLNFIFNFISVGKKKV